MGFSRTLIALALLPVAVQAAQSADEHLLVLGRQTQAVDSLPAAVTLISQADIENSGATSLESLLRGRAGIQVANSGSGPVLSLRGFAPDQSGANVLVLIDGRRLNSQSLAGPALASLRLGNIARIEVLQGSAGVLYGDQAVGGVINIITKGGSDGGQVSASLGSFDHQALGANLSKGFANGLYVDSNLAWDKADNYRDHSQSRTASVQGRLGYRTQGRHLYAELGWDQDDRDQPGPLTFSQTDRRFSRPEFAKDFINQISQVARLGLEQQLDDNWQLLVDGSASRRERDYNQSYMDWAVDNPSETTERLNRISPRLKGQLGELAVLAGIDYEHGNYDDDSLGAHNSRDSQSLYANGQWQHQALTLSAGLRYTDVDDDLIYASTYAQGVSISRDATTWSLAGQYQLDQAGRLFARIDRNVRFAKLDEQGYTPAGILGLDPQKGLSVELGWAGEQLSLSAFRLDLKDEIVFDANAPAPEGGLFAGANVNADQSRRYGVNLAGHQDFGPLTLGVDYQWLDAQFTKGASDGHKVPWVSRHSGLLYGDLVLSKALSARVEYQYRGSQYLLSDNLNQGDKVGSYGLWNLAGIWQQGPWHFVLRVDNLFDKRFADYAVYNAWGEDSWYPGKGRELNLTARYNF
ncbi:TonB-dependent receptor family protein [Gallaecimonas xiamenensis]|uniref:TonB-dependent siderophore receptor n=1 Tax=Gallaecimonas xiamenensis 3-C-1 TaxID=745411 RepID=K2KH38_9GAMM|nr:TonB-dependent receptor [Gallaecimonas xiamenensis]EKE76590.1 TonB-dependent siderophore receptor [Gallaecimonas xiamenensis 3-C-1]